ncbi:MAG: glycosyltransferase family 2 protein [Candidatus Eremiobacteraeota bacterium]|nr:glycosyltransferase family 2 protein [Candidatus Eremiobacteraeota bacterium]
MDHEKQPWLSVMVLNYNYSRYLPKTIESILGQDFGDFHLWIVDDCSTDDSLEVIQRYADRDSRIRVHALEKNLGANKAGSAGVRLLDGEYSTLCNADDFFFPGAFSYGKRFMDAHPDVDLLYDSGSFADEHGRPYGAFVGTAGYFALKPSQLRNVRAYDDRNELVDLLINGVYLGAGGTFTRTELLQRIGFPEHDEAAQTSDYEFSVGIAASGAKISFRNHSTAIDRQHQGNSRLAYAKSMGPVYRGVLYILEKYVTEDVADMLRYRRDDILRRIDELLFAAKQDPQAWKVVQPKAAEVVPLIKERLDRIAASPRREPEKWPRVSVIVPVRGDDLIMLADSLESVAAQTYADWEIVAVGSPRYSLGPILANFPFSAKIRYFEQCEWVNRASARNVGLKLARGEIMTYLDEGNLYKPSHLATIVSILDSTDLRVVRNRASFELFRRTELEGTAARFTYSEPLSEGPVAVQYPPPPGSTRIWNNAPLNAIGHHRACILDAGYFDEALDAYDDWEYVLRLSSFFARTAVTDVDGVEIRISLDDLPNPTIPARAVIDTSVNQIYERYKSKDERLGIERSAQLDRMKRAIDAMDRAPQDRAARASFVKRLVGGV